MDWKVIQKEWTALVPAIMEQWPEAEEEDLLQLDGSRDALAAYLTQATGRGYDEVQEEISEWREGGVPADVRMDEVNDNLNIRASARHIGEGEDVYDDDKAFGDDDQAEAPVGRS
ncbi:hypothetical protein GCM10011534_08760 [Pseudooceanicola nanhaiensis]|jgi:uncharacterized protein YjbJ (UPF0337 family)|uniref:Uncharacterized protein n=1 Tax=Pseudooceanicola nanhaiensis TaxID=375761 RepID=A0A917WC37_9RHOB|nr:hypothetical protein [Pseudooceanicola nanhaiensis]GGL88861.1 hypothetical protein GCM10011534_08760 [Pseudooceanicola nanhaiensis]